MKFSTGGSLTDSTTPTSVLPSTLSAPGKLVLDAFLKLPDSSTLASVVLVDSGADSNFVSRAFVDKFGISTVDLPEPISLRLADGRLTTSVLHSTLPLVLSLGSHSEPISFLVSDLDPFDIVLGYSWLYRLNPAINWQDYSLTLASVRIQGRPLGAHPLFRPVPSVFPELRTSSSLLEDSSMVEDVYPFLDSNQTLVSTPVPSFVSEDYSDVFVDSELVALPPKRPSDCRIPLFPDSKPYAGKVYNLTIEEKETMKTWIAENLRKGFIRPSSSSYAAPCFFVKQKGKLRLCMDYRKLNAQTIKNKSPIPLISEMLRSLSTGSIFSTLDLRAAYNQVRIAEDDIHKTAFITPYGLFESLVLLFGLTNAVSDFQAFMNDVFRDMLGKFVLVYLDDIIIYSSDPMQHQSHIMAVLSRLRECSLFCSLSKCRFFLSQINYLGYVISRNSLGLGSSPHESIDHWEYREIHQLQSNEKFHHEIKFDCLGEKIAKEQDRSD